MEIIRGRRNLLLNSSFEVDSNSDGLPDNWVTVAASGTITPSLVASDVVGGAKSLRILAEGITTTNHSVYVAQSVSSGLPSTGTLVECSGFAHVVSLTNAIFRMVFEWRNSSNGVISSPFAAITSPNTGPQRLVFTTSVPADAASLRFVLAVIATAPSAGGEAIVDLQSCGPRRKTLSL